MMENEEVQQECHPYCIQSVQVDFPCKPYGSQIALMDRILKSLNQQKNCLLESPTGSGKSLALLCATLAWQKKRKSLLTEESENTTNICSHSNQTLCESSSKDDPSIPLIDLINDTCSQDKTDQGINAVISPHESSPCSSTLLKRPEKDDDNDFQPSKKYRTSSPLNFFSKFSFQSPKQTAIISTQQNVPSSNAPPKNVNSNFSDQPISQKSHSPDNGCPLCSLSSPHTSVTSKSKLPKIFFGTRTHKQLKQMIREFKKTAYKDTKMCVLSSRESTCIHPVVSRSISKNEECQKLLENLKLGDLENGCSYHHRAQKLTQDCVKSNSNLNEGWDIEDIVKLGKKMRACPYFGLRVLMQDADIIFCPYNYLIDPIIRDSMDISLRGNIVILDEAHNIEDNAREAASISLKQDELSEALKDLEKLIVLDYMPDKLQPLAHFLSSLSQTITRFSKDLPDYVAFDQAGKVWTGEELVAILKDIGAGPDAYKNLRSQFNEAISEEKAQETPSYLKIKGPTVNLLKNIFVILNFLFKDNLKYMSDYRCVIVKTQSTKQTFSQTANEWLRKPVTPYRQWTYSLNFWCLNPAVAVSEFKDHLHSMIVASGTLSPMVSFQSELSMPFDVRLEANHVITPSQVWVGTISVGPGGSILNGNFKNSETFTFQDELGQVILQICQTIPYGVLCFLPSYSMMEKLVARWKLTSLWDQLLQLKVVVCEPRGSNKALFEASINEFYETIRHEEGALLFAVCRGKISEGLDFADNNARAVITVGIPFPNVKDIQVDLKRQYNNKYCTQKALMPGNEWYETQAFRALNQALGRCIRHKNDWGALILIDERFQKSKKYTNSLSKWMRNKLIHYTSFDQVRSSLENFVSSKHEILETSSSRLLSESFSQVELERSVSPPLFD